MNRFETKFQLPNGTWVFPPTEEFAEAGRKIVEDILNRWSIPPIFFHFRAGGHVASVKSHLCNDVFFKIDVANFYQSTTRSMVHRGLKSLNYNQRKALQIASDSCVRDPVSNKLSLPYGFPQSPILATLSANTTLPFRQLSTLKGRGLCATVYMDDIIVSAAKDRQDILNAAFDELVKLFETSSYSLNEAKTTKPSEELVAFNIAFRKNEMSLTEERMAMFRKTLEAASNEHQIDGILRYVHSVSKEQLTSLADTASNRREVISQS